MNLVKDSGGAKGMDENVAGPDADTAVRCSRLGTAFAYFAKNGVSML